MGDWAYIIRGQAAAPVSDRQLAAILAETHGALGYTDATRMLRLTHEASGEDGAKALDAAVDEFRKAVYRHTGAALTLREARVLTWEEFEAETFTPAARGGLAGVAEVAEVLGVSRQRVAEIRKEHKDFPQPLETLKSGPVWDREQVESWERGWGRKRTGRIPGTKNPAL